MNQVQTNPPLHRAPPGVRRASPPAGWLLSLLVATGVAVAAGAGDVAHAADTTPAQQLQRFTAQAGAQADAGRGQQFFATRHAGEWSCSSCHGQPPLGAGKHADTGKVLEPLAPAANPKAFTLTTRVDKWFRRNCNDVLKRECSAAEKADVLAYLLSLKP